jgi:hypothetical protein
VCEYTNVIGNWYVRADENVEQRCEEDIEEKRRGRDAPGRLRLTTLQGF